MKSWTAAAAFLLAISVLVVIVLSTACGPVGSPTPGPAPSPVPSNTQVPVGAGFDCDHPPAVSGIVSVKEPIEGRYIVVMKTPLGGGAPGAGGAGGGARTMSRAEVTTLAQSIAAAYGGRDVRVFSAALSGFACTVGAAELVKMASDSRCLFVQQDGRKKATPLAVAAPAASSRPAAAPRPSARPAASGAASWGL